MRLTKKAKPKRAQVPRYLDSWGNVKRGYKRTLDLMEFANSGRAPVTTDVEIAVCFADLRGFTDYVHSLQKISQDNRVNSFLRDYYEIYPRAILHELWVLEPDNEKQEVTAEHAELSRLIVPTSYKNLGDGMMIVWELQKCCDARIQGLTTRIIMQAVEDLQKQFFELTAKLGPVETDSYSKLASNLRLGFGLARGHAWRLDFGRQIPYDYAGSIVNLAARLQNLARPSGIVAHLPFSESLLRTFVRTGKGSIKQIKTIKGLGKELVDVWISNDVKLPKKYKTDCC